MDRELFVPIVSLYAIAEHEGGMIDQKLLKANIDPSRVPPGQIKQVLQQLGLDPNNVPESIKQKFKMAYPTSAPASGAASGELMKDTSAPAPAKPQSAEAEVDPYHLDVNGNIVPDLPQSEWEISAILVQSRGGFQAQRLMYHFKVVDSRATAINPASVMRQFFDTFLSGSTKILLLISALVTIVAAASIMTTIYNSVSARLREIAILRALGATRARILTLICTEAIVVGFVGGIIGLFAGHALRALGSAYLQRTLGEGINWTRVGVEEWWYLLAVVVLAFLAGLVPAMKAYRTPVATNLVAV
jgi:hypothetical protein